MDAQHNPASRQDRYAGFFLAIVHYANLPVCASTGKPLHTKAGETCQLRLLYDIPAAPRAKHTASPARKSRGRDIKANAYRRVQVYPDDDVGPPVVTNTRAYALKAQSGCGGGAFTHVRESRPSTRPAADFFSLRVAAAGRSRR
jgi:hypothetical protein